MRYTLLYWDTNRVHRNISRQYFIELTLYLLKWYVDFIELIINVIELGWVVCTLMSHLYALVGYSGNGDMIWSMTGRWGESIARDGLLANSFRISLRVFLRAGIDTNTARLFKCCLRHNRPVQVRIYPRP